MIFYVSALRGRRWTTILEWPQVRREKKGSGVAGGKGCEEDKDDEREGGDDDDIEEGDDDEGKDQYEKQYDPFLLLQLRGLL